MAPKKLLTTAAATRAAKQFKKTLAEKGVPLTAMYLFGSYAKKKQRPWSDLDIAVISPRFGKDFIEESVFLNQIADTVHPLIQAHPLHPKTLRDPYSTLSAEIKKYGKKM